MWPFKSKYDKLKREEVVDAICTLEKQEADIESGIVDRAKKIEELLERAKGKSPARYGFFTQKR